LIIKTGAPDIVHAMSFRAPRVPGTKLVFTVYDVSFWAVHEYTTEENRLVCQHGLLEALSNADGFIFISQSSHDEFERYLPGWLDRNSRPWIVTPLAPRTHVPVALPEAAGDRYWLAVGSLEPRKNYETLLDAHELYWQSSACRKRLRIAGGRGWKSEKLHARVAALSSKGMVDYLGYVPDDDLPALYAGAEAVVFPSWYEGFGLPVLEAMAQGCPVICSASTSLPEVGGPAVTYVDPTAPETIAAAMLRLEAEDSSRDWQVKAGRERAKKFSWQRTAEITLDFYARLLHIPI
jgi:glycosyltransferase involved in cell wall biosynthesis